MTTMMKNHCPIMLQSDSLLPGQKPWQNIGTCRVERPCIPQGAGMFITKDLIASVRELMERHLDVYQIADRIKVDPITVSQVVSMITDQLT